jgi:hypothetical protein
MIVRVWKQNESLLVTIPAREAKTRGIKAGDLLDADFKEMMKSERGRHNKNPSGNARNRGIIQTRGCA